MGPRPGRRGGRMRVCSCSRLALTPGITAEARPRRPSGSSQVESFDRRCVAGSGLRCLPSRCAPPASPRGSLADALEQLAWRGELEAAREDHDRLEPRRALAALEQADLRAVQVAEIRERLLRETGLG